MPSKNRKRPCSLCGQDLNLWGPDRRGICPNCAKEKRKIKLLCAGRCKSKHPLGIMQAVNMVFTPGKRGGKTYKVYYCQDCLAYAKSKIRSASERQDRSITDTEAHMKRKIRAMKEG